MVHEKESYERRRRASKKKNEKQSKACSPGGPSAALQPREERPTLRGKRRQVKEARLGVSPRGRRLYACPSKRPASAAQKHPALSNTP
eukprot:scaffold2885_cov25-Prasinocladus_malaysianus.AAC.3